MSGLLCKACNTALGFLEDSPGRLARAMAYLEGGPDALSSPRRVA